MSVVAFVEHGSPRRQFASLARTEAVTSAAWESDGHRRPERLERIAIGDLGPDDHAVVFASSRALTCHRLGVRCRTSLLLLEPRAVQGRFYAAMPILARRFHRVFTHHAPLVARVPNARLIAHGGSWLARPVDPLASRCSRMSLIASAKASTEGQRLRHRLARWAAAERIDVDLLGRGYRRFDDRAEGFLPYRHSVVIENSRDPGYFTEKLVDCLLCGTVPIYWGDPEIGRVFDASGIITCGSEHEVREAMRSADVDDFDRRRTARERNAAIAARHADHRPSVARILSSDGS